MTQYDPDWIRTYYDAYGMKEWHRWDESKVERVKLHVHLHHLRRYVASDDRVLEIGAGAGRFTQQLASLSDGIVVADISPVQLTLNRENAQRLGFADRIERWVECDMCRLDTVFDAESFDTVVCYGGPLSYVFDRRKEALEQLCDVVRPGGMILISVMSLWGAVHQYLPGVLDVDIADNRRILETGDLTPETVGPNRHYAHMYRSSELRALLLESGLEILCLSASNCLSTGWQELLNGLSEDDPAWTHLLEMEIESCQQPGCLDAGTHLLAVCRRPASAGGD
jgi:SAM-dependent methyltransferase